MIDIEKLKNDPYFPSGLTNCFGKENSKKFKKEEFRSVNTTVIAKNYCYGISNLGSPKILIRENEKHKISFYSDSFILIKCDNYYIITEKENFVTLASMREKNIMNILK